MAFDEARGAGSGGRGNKISRTAKPGGGGGGGGSAFDSAAFASSSGASGYGATASSASQGGDPAYARFRDTVERDLKKLTSMVAATRSQVEKLGGKGDSSDLRKRIDANIAKGRDIVKSLGGQLKTDFESHIRSADITRTEQDARKTQLNRFMKDYKAAVDSFQEVANTAVNGMRRHAVPTRAEDDERANDSRDKKKAQEQDNEFMQQLQRVDLTESLLHEREAAIDDITSSMAEVNEAFKDLAQIVEDQGHSLEQIEVNVGDANARTEKGVENLQQAAGYQKKYRKWLVFLLIFVICLAAGIAAYFVIEMQKNKK